MISKASCTDRYDNPVTPSQVRPETPEQQVFWAPFDAWKTDSCTAGDDFYMYMLGTWWKNPVDIYPTGLLPYASQLNNQRVNDIFGSNPNLQHLYKQLKASLTVNMSKEEVDQMVKDKVDELWAGATTREEALAAMGRAWAQGYSTMVEPIVDMVNGVPTWMLIAKLPSYVSANMLYKDKEDWWRLYGTHQIADMSSRRAQNVYDDLGTIIVGMNFDIDYMVLSWDAYVTIQEAVDNEWLPLGCHAAA